MHVELPKAKELEQRVFDIHNEKDFWSIALDVYHFQFDNNPIYQDYCLALGKTPGKIGSYTDIPFLPISFFKTHRVETTAFDPQLVFRSSGTTGSATSSHFVKYAGIYEESFRRCFGQFYGEPESYCIIGLLPSYLERGQSSLVYMVDHLVKESGHPESGFYLHDHEKLNRTLHSLERSGQRTLLIGVTYALLDFADAFPQPLTNTIIMETGGMKGRRREIIRAELYERLKKAFGLSRIHSEYGMTELLSQAYGIDGRFRCPEWMRVLMRDETDPLSILPASENPVPGAINVIDLANLYSCSFLATEDIGRLGADGNFEVLGRLDNSDIRGCSLLTV